MTDMPPRVTAMLAWFDEPVDLLAQAVESLEGFCDRVVAFDGAYELIDGATAKSPADQVAAIRAAAKNAGVAVEVYQPEEVWSGQVEKRHALLQQAANPAKADWVMPLDADWVLGGNKPSAVHQLFVTNVEALICHFYTPADPARDVSVTAANEWHVHTIGVQNMPLIYRVMDDMRVTFRHWWYSARRPDGTEVALWGDPCPERASSEPLTGLQIEHRTHFRDVERIVRNRDFCRRRDIQVSRTGAEA